MDETAAALIALTTEIGNMKGAVGTLTGVTNGLGREIGDLKTLVSNNSTSCGRCKDEIYEQLNKVDLKVEDLKAHGAAISQQNAEDVKEITEKALPELGRRVGIVEKHCEAEKSISSWKDKTLTEIGQIVATVSGIIGLTALVVGWALHVIWTGALL